MKTLQVSKFKAQCLGLLKEIRATREPLAVTLRGKTLAIVHSASDEDPAGRESVADSLRRLRPLLLVEDEEFVPPERVDRPSAQEPLAETTTP